MGSSAEVALDTQILRAASCDGCLVGGGDCPAGDGPFAEVAQMAGNGVTAKAWYRQQSVTPAMLNLVAGPLVCRSR